MIKRSRELSGPWSDTDLREYDDAPFDHGGAASSIEEAIEAAVERAVERAMLKYLATSKEPEPAVYTIGQAAHVLQVSHDTVWRLVKRGELRKVPLLTGKTLIPRRALNELLASEPSPSEAHRVIRLKTPCRPSAGPSDLRLAGPSPE
jgi:excisionase family DNA binding protein